MNTNNYKKVVHAAIWHNGKILLCQRLAPGFHQYYWSDPGGKVEKTDIFPINSLIREVKEETGLDISSEIINFIDSFIYDERQIKTFVFEIYLPGFHLKDLKNTEPAKHSDWQWFTIKEALELKLLPSVKFYLEGFYRK